MDSQQTISEVVSYGDTQVIEALSSLSFHQLARLRKYSGVVIEDKYERSRGSPKYGNLPKHFSERQILEFFGAITSDELKVEFLVLLVFGLRVSELDDLVWLEKQGLLRVNNKKSVRVEYLPVFDSFRGILKSFFVQECHSTKKLRHHFRAVCECAGDEFTYIYAQTTHKTPRNLYQFSTHTLRHTAGNLLLRATDNPYKVSQYLRHSPSSKFGVTATYMHYSMDEMRADLENVFARLIKEIME